MFSFCIKYQQLFSIVPFTHCTLFHASESLKDIFICVTAWVIVFVLGKLCIFFQSFIDSHNKETFVKIDYFKETKLLFSV